MKLGWNVINIQVNWIAVNLKHAWSSCNFCALCQVLATSKCQMGVNQYTLVQN